MESLTETVFISILWESLFLVKFQAFTIICCFGRLIKSVAYEFFKKTIWSYWNFHATHLERSSAVKFKSYKIDIIKSSVSYLKKSTFLLQTFKLIKKNVIHQRDYRRKYSFTFSQRSLCFEESILFYFQVFWIESCRFRRWVLDCLVGWSVVGEFN